MICSNDNSKNTITHAHKVYYGTIAIDLCIWLIEKTIYIGVMQQPVINNEFLKMKRIATFLFVLMVVIYCLSKFFEKQIPILTYVRVFSEAAMVGALADWFAVTALFRHPLGLPIPHTAIIPKSKDRIGIGLGNFISRNFLKPEQVEARLVNIDLIGALTNLIKDSNKRSLIANGIAKAIPKTLGLLNDGPISQWIETSIKAKLLKLDLASFIADGIELIIKNNRHQPVIDLIIFHTNQAMSEYEPEFRNKVSKNTKWFPKLFSVDNSAADSLINSIKETLTEAANNNEHPLRNNINTALTDLAISLKLNTEVRSNLNNWYKEFLFHPNLAQFFASIWLDIKANITNSDHKIEEVIDKSLLSLAGALENNLELKESLNINLKTWAKELANNNGELVGKMVADTIKGWDATTVVNQIEGAVGRDLQYIRINGTVIGGIVGLLIYLITNIFIPQ